MIKLVTAKHRRLLDTSCTVLTEFGYKILDKEQDAHKNLQTGQMIKPDIRATPKEYPTNRPMLSIELQSDGTKKPHCKLTGTKMITLDLRIFDLDTMTYNEVFDKLSELIGEQIIEIRKSPNEFYTQLKKDQDRERRQDIKENKRIKIKRLKEQEIEDEYRR